LCFYELFFSQKWAGGFVTFEIIILALVAAFLGLRLYSALGKRTGHEQEPLLRKPLEERQPPVIRPPVINSEPAPSGSSPIDVDIDLAAQSGLRAIMNADRQFDPGLFMEGAKSAYKLTLEAYWKGDRDALKFLCDADVYESFSTVINAREDRGEIVDNRLVRIEECRIIDAKFDHPTARITLKFDADIATIIKDKDGNIIGGSMTDAEEAHDIWTFTRDIKSTDRNWVLDETDQA
jgi:predicted lipid-binding transport protein (Tim44 family)